VYYYTNVQDTFDVALYNFWRNPWIFHSGGVKGNGMASTNSKVRKKPIEIINWNDKSDGNHQKQSTLGFTEANHYLKEEFGGWGTKASASNNAEVFGSIPTRETLSNLNQLAFLKILWISW
jgi:hypothetical protein